MGPLRGVAGLGKPRALEIGAGLGTVEKIGWWKPGDMAQYAFTTFDLYAPADVKWDFNKLPYPFEDNSFDAVFARSVLEHVKLGLIIDVMKEIHRISKPGALVYALVPYWNSKGQAQDPTHETRFSEEIFYHFCGMRGYYYIPKLFDLVQLEYRFHPKLWWWPKFAKVKLMNMWSEVCTELWVVLRVVKEGASP